MKSKFIYILFLLMMVQPRVTNAQKPVKNQQFAVTSKKGITEFWSKEKKAWEPLKNLNDVKTSTTIATRDNSELQITFEPAIYFTLKENSLFQLNNHLVQNNSKIIRMSISLQKGNADIRIQSLSGYTLLLTVETPSAVFTAGDADAEFSAGDNSTILQVYRGNIHTKHTGFDLQSVVFEGSRAKIQINHPSIEITGASEEKPAEQHRRGPSIAILSIHSQIKNDKNTDAISNVVAENYQKKSNARVLYLDDIRELLKSEKGESLLNCFTDSCITKISTMVGVDVVILGSIGQVGQKYLFSLKMIDVLRDKTLQRLTTSVDSNLGLIVDKIPEMVGELVQTQKSSLPDKVTPKPSDSTGIRKTSEEIIWIPPGTLQMGMKDPEDFDAIPVHNVSIRGFYIDKYEVTKEAYEQVTGNNPSAFRGCNSCPVDNVTWQEAQDYCQKLGKRLPTEAEWEYACRAGTASYFHYGNTLSSEQANFDGTNPFGGVPKGVFKGKPVPVGTYKPNDWGLYDMHGNIAEWCSDWYNAAYYGNSDEKDPKGPTEGTLKVVRGGSWNNTAQALRSGKRAAYNPTLRVNSIGFRCVKDDYGKK